MSAPREWRCQRDGCDEHGIQTRGRGRKFCSDRCRKLTLYYRPCVVCGTPADCTTPGKQPDPESPVCRDCAPEYYKIWTADALVCWIQDHAVDGVPLGAHEARRLGFPLWCCQREFGSWNKAVEAAGFKPRDVGERIDQKAWENARFGFDCAERRARIIDMWNAGVPTGEIAAEFNITGNAVRTLIGNWRRQGEDVAYRAERTAVAA